MQENITVLCANYTENGDKFYGEFSFVGSGCRQCRLLTQITGLQKNVLAPDLQKNHFEDYLLCDSLICKTLCNFGEYNKTKTSTQNQSHNTRCKQILKVQNCLHCHGMEVQFQ